MSKTNTKAWASGVRWKNGAWRYRVPRWIDSETRSAVFSGKAEVTLGANMADATEAYSRLMNEIEGGTPVLRTLGDLMDRYLIEHAPRQSPHQQRSLAAAIQRLRPVFAHMEITEFEARHAFTYRERRSSDAPIGANRELEVLSHLFSKAIEWGAMRNEHHPLRGLRIKNREEPRQRYVTDDELNACLELASPFLSAYVGLKLQLGIRKGDMLRLEMSDADADGIVVRHSKTAGSTGKATLYPWNDSRVLAWSACRQIRPLRGRKAPWLFVTRDGASYIKQDGQTSGFDSIFRRWIDKCLAIGVLGERFTENDLRAKVASDATSIEQARRRLGHSTVTTTRRHYARKPEIAD